MPKRERDRDLVDEMLAFPVYVTAWGDDDLTDDEVAEWERNQEYRYKREAWRGTSKIV